MTPEQTLKKLGIDLGMGSLPMGIPVEIEVIVEAAAGAARSGKPPRRKKRR